MTRRAVSFLLLLGILCGCDGRRRPENPAPHTRPQRTLAEEIRARISRQVLRGVPVRGQLERVRSTGILRVALPPPEPPFQRRDAALNAPRGFNVDLAEEIAGALLVKANIELLSSNSAAAAGCGAGRFDIVFSPAAAKFSGGVPYFFDGPGGGWRAIRACGAGDSLRRAVENILAYLNESGVFYQMYAAHFPRAAETGKKK